MYKEYFYDILTQGYGTQSLRMLIVTYPKIYLRAKT